MKFYVDPKGNDENKGTEKSPFKTISCAQKAVQDYLKENKEPVRVFIQEGTYYLSEPILFTAKDSGYKDAPVTYEGVGHVVLSGGVPLLLDWKMYRDGIYKANLDWKQPYVLDRLSVNNREEMMARYPSYDPKAKYFNGYAEDSISEERLASYLSPKGGYIHAMHEGLWGDFHYEIEGRDEEGRCVLKGGHQNNRPSKMHETIRYIENVFEELTDEREWYFDQEKAELYYKPDAMTDIGKAHIVGGGLKNLISFEGTESDPVRYIELRNFSLQNTARTFMEPMEPLLRSDWCIYRGGAVYLEGTEDVILTDCQFDQVGGNGIFVSRYNNRTWIEGCYFRKIGGSGVVFCGDSSAVRSPLFRYEESHEGDVDWEKGPKNNQYPRECTVQDCLIDGSGRVEKQTAGVCISMAHKIRVLHNCIYNVPRAGINVCDGTWGGHDIAYNAVFDTVLETSDHGAFNSWGRDRFWDSDFDKMAEGLEQMPTRPMLDVIDTIHIRHNVFQCDHGWDIDLDDGSSNYDIYNNLCLSGGIKNREGIRRHVYNNVMLNNTFHPHRWFKNSQDRFENNVVFDVYKEYWLEGWGEVFDNNVLYQYDGEEPALALQEKSGMDIHSVCKKYEYHRDDYKTCGLIKNKYRHLAKNVFDKENQVMDKVKVDTDTYTHLGMTWKALSGLGELSATGMYQEMGMIVLEVEPGSYWEKQGIVAQDVILEVGDQSVQTGEQLVALLNGKLEFLVIWRQQSKCIISVKEK